VELIKISLTINSPETTGLLEILVGKIQDAINICAPATTLKLRSVLSVGLISM
jgi:hypothetical protein